MDEDVDLGGVGAYEIRDALDHAQAHMTQIMIVFSRTPGPAADDAQAVIGTVRHDAQELDALDPDNDSRGKKGPNGE
jgi:hypothetical protein